MEFLFAQYNQRKKETQQEIKRSMTVVKDTKLFRSKYGKLMQAEFLENSFVKISIFSDLQLKQHLEYKTTLPLSEFNAIIKQQNWELFNP